MVDEYRSALKTLSDGSPGPDRMNRAYLRKIDATECSLHFNLWLYAKTPPSTFRVGITSLVPKVSDTKLPQEHRPITVSNIICRQFHRVLACRLEELVPLSPRQKAFHRGDGLADNAILLRSIIKDRCAKNRSINICFIDVAKAFDSVSHDSLLIAAKRLGVPDNIICYLQSLYSGCSTSFKVEGVLRRSFSVNKEELDRAIPCFQFSLTF